jgi:hypothetical protein
MFLSHPAAGNENKDISTLPRCTKADAIRIILCSMLNNEKTVIFSLYISVLTVYAKICRDLGFATLIITSRDKGKKLKEKLLKFENLAKNRVLLTTLQKSAEGFNFHFATHVIILEFWWNPQKILQAMSRIDRKTQTRNIFIYLLCYNYKEEMIRQEKRFYEKMINKLNDANTIYKIIEQKHPKKNPMLKTLYNDIPEIILFKSIDTFEKELESYTYQFSHTGKIDRKTHDEQGYLLIDVKNQLVNKTNNYFNICNVPWLLKTEEVKLFFNDFYNNKITEGKKYLVEQPLRDTIIKSYFYHKLDYYYQVIFCENIHFKVKITNRNISELNLLYLVGKKKEGKYDLLGIYRTEWDKIFDDQKKRRFKSAHIMVTNKISLGKRVQLYFTHHFPDLLHTFCVSSIFENVTFKKNLPKMN